MFRSELVPWFFPSGESRMRNAGWVSCMAPLKYPTSPDSITFVSLVRPLAMNFALKNVAVTLLRPVPNVMRRPLLPRLLHRERSTCR